MREEPSSQEFELSCLIVFDFCAWFFVYTKQHSKVTEMLRID